MLTTCPECGLQVSDKALSCPHCGLPLQSEVKRKPRKSNRRKRLPNGFGQISEIKGQNLRNPFRAMVCIGKTDEGRPICKLLKPQSYFPTYNDAYSALVEYNKNPYDLDSCITMKELYERWSDKYFPKMKNEKSAQNIDMAWKYCSALYDMKVSDIRIRHLKQCILNATRTIDGIERSASRTIQKRMKSIFNQMLDYAVEYEIVDKNYSRSFGLKSILEQPEEIEQAHISFSENEMEKLWAHLEDIPYVDILLIQCYSGWRPQELGLIELKNVDLDNWFFTGGLKSDAGRNRVVPIHTKIRPLVKNRYEEAIQLGSQYLFNYPEATKNGMFLDYDRYWYRFKIIVKKLELNPDHRPHDGRKHFVTMAKKYNVHEYAIKYLIGHAIRDITESVYTDRENEWLAEEIEKIK